MSKSKAAPRITFTVATRDVDGGDRRRYTTAKEALARFESMSGWTLRAALEEQALSYGDAVTPVSPEAFLARDRGAIRAVSDFGCVVVLSFERHEPTEEERKAQQKREERKAKAAAKREPKPKGRLFLCPETGATVWEPAKK